MKICDEEKTNLTFGDLKAGDVFIARGAEGIFIKKNVDSDGNTPSNAIELRTGNPWVMMDNTKVIYYPYACVKLGDYFNG